MIPRLPRKKKLNRYEKEAHRQEKMSTALQGHGMYIFENISNGDLWLPKPDANGSKGPVPPGGKWKGDDYFHQLVKNRDAKISEILISPQVQQEQIMQEKLLVDQPDRVTDEGVVEQILPKQTLNEVSPPPTSGEKLINEDPLDGVSILLD
jgi:hypothetical protein